MSLTIVDAEAADATLLAAVHAASWRSAYRGIMLDAFLDGEAERERLDHWTARMKLQQPERIVLKALQAHAICGFACVFLDEDVRWGALLDNLHVAPEWTGRGIGGRLFDESVRRVAAARPGQGVYLWVFEANVRAQRFYERRGGRLVEQKVLDAPSGIRAAARRYAWTPVHTT